MSIDTVKKWLGIQKEDLIYFPKISNDKKIESLTNAILYLEEYQQLLSKQKWITIEEKLPENYEKVLFCTNESVHFGTKLEDDIFHKNLWWSDSANHTVTNTIAWQPLPEVYKPRE